MPNMREVSLMLSKRHYVRTPSDTTFDFDVLDATENMKCIDANEEETHLK